MLKVFGYGCVGVDDWLLFLLVVDRVMEIFVCYHPLPEIEFWMVFMVTERDSRVLGSLVVILTSCSIHEIFVDLTRCHSIDWMNAKFFLPCRHLGSYCVKPFWRFWFHFTNPSFWVVLPTWIFRHCSQLSWQL